MADAVAAEIEGALGAVLAQVCRRWLGARLLGARVFDGEMKGLFIWAAAY